MACGRRAAEVVGPYAMRFIAALADIVRADDIRPYRPSSFSRSSASRITAHAWELVVRVSLICA